MEAVADILTGARQAQSAKTVGMDALAEKLRLGKEGSEDDLQFPAQFQCLFKAHLIKGGRGEPIVKSVELKDVFRQRRMLSKKL